MSQNMENAGDNKEKAEKTYHMGDFQFRKAEWELLPRGRSWILGVYSSFTYDAASGTYGSLIYDSAYHSLFIGQLLTLFGNADYLTENNENLLSYAIEAKRDDGEIIYLEVYYGPSGPAIGGIASEEIYTNAAKELSKLIMDAEPTDFEISSTYEDVGCSVIMGVKNGKPYYEDTSPEEIDW